MAFGGLPPYTYFALVPAFALAGLAGWLLLGGWGEFVRQAGGFASGIAILDINESLTDELVARAEIFRTAIGGIPWEHLAGWSAIDGTSPGLGTFADAPVLVFLLYLLFLLASAAAGAFRSVRWFLKSRPASG